MIKFFSPNSNLQPNPFDDAPLGTPDKEKLARLMQDPIAGLFFSDATIVAAKRIVENEKVARELKKRRPKSDRHQLPAYPASLES